MCTSLLQALFSKTYFPDLEPVDPDEPEVPDEPDLEDDPDVVDPEAPPEALEVVDLPAFVLPDVDEEEDPDFEDPFELSFLVAILF